MPVVLKPPDRFFYLAWVGLHLLSVLLALAVSWAIIVPVESIVGASIVIGGQTHITEDYLLSYLFVPALGLAHGLLQYLLLRRYLPTIGWWAVATALGWMLALFGTGMLYAAVGTQAGDQNALLLRIARVGLTGGSIGLAQWGVLRRRVPRAGWWIAANVIGWGISEVLSSWLDLWVLGAPALATVVAWWYLLERLPHGEAKPGGPKAQAPM